MLRNQVVNSSKQQWSRAAELEVLVRAGARSAREHLPDPADQRARVASVLVAVALAANDSAIIRDVIDSVPSE